MWHRGVCSLHPLCAVRRHLPPSTNAQRSRGLKKVTVARSYGAAAPGSVASNNGDGGVSSIIHIQHTAHGSNVPALNVRNGPCGAPGGSRSDFFAKSTQVCRTIERSSQSADCAWRQLHSPLRSTGGTLFWTA
jgi:hypothetical protein